MGSIRAGGLVRTCLLIAWFFVIAAGISACSTENNFAPVTEVSAIQSLPRSGTHRVKPGETLYAIAWRYGLDYRYLAERNHVTLPYHIYTNQIIYLTGKAQVDSEISGLQKPTISADENATFVPITNLAAPTKITPEPTQPVRAWLWPARGRVVGHFSGLNKGISVSGHEGDPIYAAAAGKVVYCGDGLRGYGNLIIIKHNSLFLSAYAHNQALFVREGDLVKQGQKIAEMGHTGTDKNILYFEIRRAGKPVNPIPLLN